jgi:hypothetical protein
MPGFSQPYDVDALEVCLGALVEGGLAQAPAPLISGALSDLVALLVAPLVGGVSNPIDARGRPAIGMFASRRVRIDGGLGLMRSFQPGVARASSTRSLTPNPVAPLSAK